MLPAKEAEAHQHAEPVGEGHECPAPIFLLSTHIGFEVIGDGNRFVIQRPVGDRARPPSVTVIQNWYSEFKGRK